MKPAIAIVGLACCYPDARSPAQLWENVLAGRRAFRQMPPERLNLKDYFDDDSNYSGQAAVIEGYEFDRLKYKVVGSTYRSADLVHWLALDIAAQALADAGFVDGLGLPQERTGVLLGNTLTGEFSRANTLGLRWAYVRRVAGTVLARRGESAERIRDILADLESMYQQPFVEVGAETLAGNLSNTIAGRICNYFDLKGGGYTIDGACSSSLLAVAHACNAIVLGDLEVAIAGGVDLSLDPFELVGFARAGALAGREMRVYDARSGGFFPGEGCGFAVLMDAERAIAENRRIYSIIRGWGISSDGSGGMTRPEVAGQLLALQRAYERSGFAIDTVSYFEGHGTGTAVGDETELRALSAALSGGKKRGGDAGTRESKEEEREIRLPAIGSIKANIGHTKAAAGIAGLIKATLAAYHRVIPPTTGCEHPHPELSGQDAVLRVLKQAEIWQGGNPLRVGVSGMGFGGINAHLVLESPVTERREKFNLAETKLIQSQQDGELFLFNAENAADLQAQVRDLLAFADRLSLAELTDLAATLSQKLGNGKVKAAIAAATPQQLANNLQILDLWLLEEIATRLDVEKGVFLCQNLQPGRIGFLFPGQASPTYLDGGAWERRFPDLKRLYRALPKDIDLKSTAIAQPAIVTSSIAGLQVLSRFGVSADLAIGHSLGELTALHWGGVWDESIVVAIAIARGEAMALSGHPAGAMASIQADEIALSQLIGSNSVFIAGLNSPQQTVISGDVGEVGAVVDRAINLGWKAVQLPVDRAFHSPLIAGAIAPLREYLEKINFNPLDRKVVSTVTGDRLTPETDLLSLLCTQITSPVRFIKAISQAATAVDLFIEVGAGRVLTGLARDCTEIPTINLDAGGSSLKGLLHALGAAFALGIPIRHEALFSDRFFRPFNLDWQPKFLINPCELAPDLDLERKIETRGRGDTGTRRHGDLETQRDEISTEIFNHNQSSPWELVRELVAQRVELPVSAVRESDRLLADLHLNSISVAQIVVEAWKSLGLTPPTAPTQYANATVGEVAEALQELLDLGGAELAPREADLFAGVDSWVRTFTVKWVEKALKFRQLPLPDESEWQIIASAPNYLIEALKNAFTGVKGKGSIVCLTPDSDRSSAISLLLQGSQAVLADPAATHFILVQQGISGAGLARTLHLEAPRITTCVLDIPLDIPEAVDWIVAESQAAVGYVEARYDRNGKRGERRLHGESSFLEAQFVGGQSLAPSKLYKTDVLLVTGGGKGIAAECALKLAKETGVKLALLGRSDPDRDAELAANLARIKASGVQVEYAVADVTDAIALREAIERFEANFGQITAIIHGAGINVPKLIPSLTVAEFEKTVSIKVGGLENVLAVVDRDRLQLLVTFGSIIAETGLPGEADYAIANEWLADTVAKFQLEHPSCHCLNLEWSIWSGVGMGERLGRVEILNSQGITAIPPDIGINILSNLLHLPILPLRDANNSGLDNNSQSQIPNPKSQISSILVTGRFGTPPTLKIAQPELPFLRFLEQPKVYYPGVELVVDIELSSSSDRYLDDHIWRGERLFPAVMGLEAMAQVAMALAETEEIPIFEAIKFHQPVVVSTETLKIRIAALVKNVGEIAVVLRTEATSFQVNHFEATCRFGNSNSQLKSLENPQSTIHNPQSHRVSLNPATDLYQNILFHTGRFQRLQGYRKLRSTECVAEISSDSDVPWFSRYLPSDLILGDPGVRDAAIHALQACIPHATILPLGVERLIAKGIVGAASQNEIPTGNYLVWGQEKQRINDIFIYDLEITNSEGTLVERWEGLQLKLVELKNTQTPWVAALVAPYIERRIAELIPETEISVVLERDSNADSRTRSDRTICRALDLNIPVWRRPDGKPEVESDLQVSVAHAGSLTIAIAGLGKVGCDIEPVVARSSDMWRELLGGDRFLLAKEISQHISEDMNLSATRVWCAIESLKKVGIDSHLIFDVTTTDNWVILRAGELIISTFVLALDIPENKLTLALTIEPKKQTSIPFLDRYEYHQFTSVNGVFSDEFTTFQPRLK